ncbi:hypothetical protein H0W91_01020 [Patescibacteria group bacterium]|nr:hypothetical protein [Patescibacteria group bacterium]
MTTVVPAIIPHTKAQLEEEIRKVAQFATIVQIDISDGIFVPTKTWPYNGRDLEYFDLLKTEQEGWPRWEDLEIEIHLMIKSPEIVVLDWIKTGATSIVAHIESTDNFQKVIDLCRENSVLIGIAIKPSTDISRIASFVPNVDFIQCMGSDFLGKHGVVLDPKAIEQITALHTTYPEKEIAIDIGVNEETAQELVSAGATKLISGKDILESSSPEEAYNYLKSIE